MLVLLALLSVLGYLYVRFSFNHWKRCNITQVEAGTSFGNTRMIFTGEKSMADVCHDAYFQLKEQGAPYGGFYFALKPTLVVVDPEVIKHIMVNDFQHFTDRAQFYDEDNDPLTAHLFNIGGPKWRSMRIKLTPTFTSGKMKMMFPTLLDCSEGLFPILDEAVGKSAPVDIKELLARFTTDVIGSCAFGIECNCLADPDTDFRRYGNETFKPRGVEVLRRFCAQLIPNVLKFFRIRGLNKSITSFFLNIVKDVVDHRERNNVIRNDFLQMLLQLKNQGRVLDDNCAENVKGTAVNGMTIEQIAAQCFVFFLAGFETSSTTMTFCCFELCLNQDIQEKLRKEVIDVVTTHGGLTYEAVTKLKYMDQVLNETMRKYPPVPVIVRTCTKDYKFPGTDSMIKTGDHVRIPLLGLQRDPELYPDPMKFDPDRFSPENKDKLVPYTYMPFGEGPRICIGLRFGLMQAKVGLSVLLMKYRMSLNESMKLPLVMDPFSFTLSTKEGIWLNLETVDLTT